MTRRANPLVGSAWLVVAALALLAVTATVVWRARFFSEQVNATSPARRDVVRTLVLTARVRPSARPQVGANMSGVVREVLVREGDRVRRGQLLFRLDDAPQTAALAQAQAAFAVATARTQSTVEQAELAVQSTARDAKRARALFAQGAISQREREEAERAAANAVAERDAAGARAGGSTATVFAEVARARAAVAAAEAQLGLTRVRAPANGTVLARSVEPGDAVLPGQVLLELALDGATELVAFAREENLASLDTGASVAASADAFPDSTFPARVSWLSPMVDPAQGTVEVRFSVAAPPAYLRPDMTISVNVDVQRRADALVITLDVVGDIGSATPWVVVARDGRAVRQPVRLGLRGDRDAEVLSGLTQHDHILPAATEVGRRVKVVGVDTSRTQRAPIR